MPSNQALQLRSFRWSDGPPCRLAGTPFPADRVFRAMGLDMLDFRLSL